MMKIYGIEFAAAQKLLFLGLFFSLFIAFLLYHLYVSNRIVRSLVSTTRQQNVLTHYQWWRRAIKYGLFLAAVFFVSVALLRPQWDLKDQTVEQHGRDILIAVDISRSMLAQDIKPNRLEFAKEKIKRLLYNLSCDRVGLMLFAGTTTVQCPLTNDYSTFFMFLDQLDVETISSSTTALDNAIAEAVNVFDRMPERKSKIFCLFTDGEDFSDNLAAVKDQAAAAGVSIFTIGVGSEHGAPIPVLDNRGVQIGLEKDETGAVVMSQLNESVLQDLAEQCGGKYIHAVESEEDVKELIALVEKFEADRLADKKINRLEEQYPYFVAIGFICLLLEWIL
jgi:Ca-activated chloride channel family protein